MAPFMELKLKTNWPKQKRGSSERVNFNFFTASQIAASKLIICEIAKKESYPSEYYALSNGKPVKQSSEICHADLLENAKHQVILVEDRPLSSLIIQNIHEEHFHVAREQILALSRQHY